MHGDWYVLRTEWELEEFEREQIAAMTYPVRCTHCRRVYDSAMVEITARWLDCTEWISPCCGRKVDDRGTGPFGKSRRDIEELY